MKAITRHRAVSAATAAVALMLGTGQAFADINGCPNGGIGNPQTSDRVSVTALQSGNTVTYTFQPLVIAGSNGVPGLIEYCVYPGAQPDSTSVVATGADGTAWKEPPSFDNFSFQRPDGNPSNIPYDGASHEMGTATWNSGVPDNFNKILLHINDASECDRLYGGNPGTCFVLPGTNEQLPKPPTVSKSANPAFGQAFAWTIAKEVDKTIVKQVGGSATFNYTIGVSHDDGTFKDWKVTGIITVTNPAADDITVDVTDAVDNGGVCTVADGIGVLVAGNGGTVNLDYACTYSSAPNPSAGTNTATATLEDGETVQGTATFDFGSLTPTAVDSCVEVTDSYAGTLGRVCVGDRNPTTFTYARTIEVPVFDCQSYDNTATYTTNDSGTTGSANQTVTVCGPAKTGALTMGFWQNKNGQAIITGGASTGGVCNSGTWLRQYNPFQDLSATASCSQVAKYVSNIVKTANARGSSMNAMLKAQMLATALDVYFSDPSLGGNRIGAPAPIGGVHIDVTLICTDQTCSAFEDVSSVFPSNVYGKETVAALLSDASGASNLSGSFWYGNVKAAQELAKDTFDAINNQLAFDP